MRVFILVTTEKGAVKDQKHVTITDDKVYPQEKMYQDLRYFMLTPIRPLPNENLSKEDQRKLINKAIDNLLAQLYTLK